MKFPPGVDAASGLRGLSQSLPARCLLLYNTKRKHRASALSETKPFCHIHRETSRYLSTRPLSDLETFASRAYTVVSY